MIGRLALIGGAVLGFLSVALDAFGAHALKQFLTTNARLDTYQLAGRYMFYHALALILMGILMQIRPSVKFKYGAICFGVGVVLFSGSLYVLCFTGLGALGLVTPIGGILLILGWAFLIVGASQK